MFTRAEKITAFAYLLYIIGVALAMLAAAILLLVAGAW